MGSFVVDVVERAVSHKMLLLMLLLVVVVRTTLAQQEGVGHGQVNKAPGDGLEAVGAALQSLVENPPPPRGKGFPEIQGPHPSDRVCIVGAGIAGIHMALELKRMNYNKVEIFEKSQRLGGKAFDIEYRGVPQAHGALLLYKNHEANVLQLAKQYGAKVLRTVDGTSKWQRNDDGPGSISPHPFDPVNKYLARLTNTTNYGVNMRVYYTSLLKYVQLHRELFGGYNDANFFMPRPSPAVLYRARGTLLQFLTREDLLPLVPFFNGAMTLPGYGYVDEVSALYALIFVNPDYVASISYSALGIEAQYPYYLNVLEEGVENLFRRIVDQEGLKVHYNIEIRNIHRTPRAVHLRLASDEQTRTEECDFLIWAAPASEYLSVLSDEHALEHSLLSGLKTSVYTSSLVNMNNVTRNGPVTVFGETLGTRAEHGVLLDVDNAGLQQPEIHKPERIAAYNRDNGPRTAVVFQLGRRSASDQHLNAILRQHYGKGFNARDIEILSTRQWRYFPRWSPAEMDKGQLWNVIEQLQGRKRTWLTGSAVSFDLTAAALDYNRLLLDNMKKANQPQGYTLTTGYQPDPWASYRHHRGLWAN